MSETPERTTHTFQTEARQLLDLMVHSLYSNKEIFLRELVSNASDACDKLRFEALTDPALLEDEPDLAIHVRSDADARTITVRDNGVGMSRQEVIDNIGNHREVGDAGVRREADRRSTDGRAAHRPVRRRVLLRLHRRRARRADDAAVGPRRRGRGPLGEARARATTPSSRPSARRAGRR